MVWRTNSSRCLVTFFAGLSAGATLSLVGLYVMQDYAMRRPTVVLDREGDCATGQPAPAPLPADPTWMIIPKPPPPEVPSVNVPAGIDVATTLTSSGSGERIDIESYLATNRTEEEAHVGENELAEELFKKIRILCFVMTQPTNHESRAKTVKDTWGKRCNILYFVSTTPVNNSETAIFQGNESRDILWGKTKTGFKYAYENYFEDADWFVKADDDTYLIMENMRFLLLDKDPATPVHYGCKYKVIVKQGYMSGGAGYVLSKEALRRFVEESLPNPEKCRQDDAGAEDAEIGICLERVGVAAGDSRDQEAKLRFFPFVPQDHASPGKVDMTYWYWKNIYYMHEPGIECCSDSVIGFHYVDERLMWAMEYLIYHVHPFGIEPQLTGSAIKDDVIDYLNGRNLTIVTKTAISRTVNVTTVPSIQRTSDSASSATNRTIEADADSKIKLTDTVNNTNATK